MLQRVNSIVASYPLSYFAVDAVLVLAQAVNDTLTGWSNSSPDWSFCEGEESTKNASISKCFVKQKLLNIVMQGLTVSCSCAPPCVHVVSGMGEGEGGHAGVTPP